MYKSASLDLPTGCLINFINLNLPVRLLNQHLKHPLLCTVHEAADQQEVTEE